MHRSQNSHLRLAGRAADYQKLGIDSVEVAQFEDGQRIGTENRTDAVRHACQGQLKKATGVVQRVPRGLQRDMADDVAISPLTSIQEGKMETHTERREFGLNGKFSKPDWPPNDVPLAAHRMRQKALSEAMSALGRQLRTLASGGLLPLWKTWESRAPANRGHAFSSSAMIKPSMHQRVAIENHRDDRP